MRFLLLMVAMIFIVGCSSTALFISQDAKLMLYKGGEKIEVPGTLLKEEKERYSRVSIVKSIYKFDDGSLVIHEDAVLDMEYRFNGGTAESVATIFDARKSRLLYQNGNLYFFQLLLSGDQWVNVAVVHQDEKNIQMLYGFNNDKLQKSIERFGAAPMTKSMEPNVIAFDDFKGEFLTKWSLKLVMLDSLIVRDTMGRLRF